MTLPLTPVRKFITSRNHGEKIHDPPKNNGSHRSLIENVLKEGMGFYTNYRNKKWYLHKEGVGFYVSKISEYITDLNAVQSNLWCESADIGRMVRGIYQRWKRYTN